jgi:hypothetical protein
MADTLKQPLTASEKRRHKVDLHLIYKPGDEILLCSSCSAAEGDILTTGCPARLFQSRLDALGDKCERRSAFEFKRLAWMVREDEHRVMEGRIGFPPTTFHGLLVSHGPGWPPNMLRPIIEAPMFRSDSSITAVLSLTSPPSSPCIARQTLSGTTHSCSCVPPIPSGWSTLWLGPAMKPSRDIEIVKRSLDIFYLRRKSPDRTVTIRGEGRGCGNDLGCVIQVAEIGNLFISLQSAIHAPYDSLDSPDREDCRHQADCSTTRARLSFHTVPKGC